MKESNKDKTKNEIKHSLSNATIKPQDINKKLEIISEIPLFNDLSYGLFSFLNEELKEKHYKKNEYVIKQNDPINDIYLTIKGKFILTLNHQIEYDVEHDMNTFINYQNITSEPFNNDRGYEITGKMDFKNELDLFIYDTKNFLGDIEMFANSKISIFNIKAIEDDSIIGIIDRKHFFEIIEKVVEEFKENVENKLEMIYQRIKDILNQKIDLNYDELKIKKERISYQLFVNHNYDLIFEKFKRIKNRLLNNKNKNIKHNKTKNIKQHEKEKNFHKKNITRKNIKSHLEKSNKHTIFRSHSVLDMNNYEKKVMDLFKFPTVLKNDTKIVFDGFFDNIYNKNKKKKFNLIKTKFDYEPVYLNQFTNISKLDSQEKFEFLYHMNNHLQEKIKTPIHLTKNKSNLKQLITMYNYYITNKNQSKTSSKWSGFIYDKDKIINRSFGVLNPIIKNNEVKNTNEVENKIKKQSFKKPIKLDIIRFNTSLLDTSSLSNNKNIGKKINANKLFFNSIISKEIKKNWFNLNPKNNFFNQIENTNKENNNIHSLEVNKKSLQVNYQGITKSKSNHNIQDIKRKRFSLAPNIMSNNMYRNLKIKPKNIFEIILKNKCETTKNKTLFNFQKKSNNNNTNDDFIFNINNNIDIKNEDFIKNFYIKNKFNRANTIRQIK